MCKHFQDSAIPFISTLSFYYSLGGLTLVLVYHVYMLKSLETAFLWLAIQSNIIHNECKYL